MSILSKFVIISTPFIVLLCSIGATARAQNIAGSLTVDKPEYRKVYQRNEANYALVPIAGSVANGAVTVQARCTVMSGGNGRPTAWKTIATDIPAGGSFAGTLGVEAGGWYQIQVRSGDLYQVNIDEVGVGEVFITAGQSNAGNYGEGPLTPQDDRVSAWNGLGGTPLVSQGWRFAYDPQPVARQYTALRGSPWPAMADVLAQRLEVPIGVLSVAWGGTTAAQWADPISYAYPRLRDALREAGPNGVRAILWHQGEADVNENTEGADYIAALKNVIERSRAECGWSVPWLIARASYMPWSILDSTEKARFNNKESLFNLQMTVISDAQAAVANDPAMVDVYSGPTTDDMRGAGLRWDQVHLTVQGLREHGRRWARTLLQTPELEYPGRALTFVEPVNGASLTRFSAIRGTTASYFGDPDANPGEILSNPDIKLTIRRMSDGSVWDAAVAAWTSTEATLTATVDSGTWICPRTLPAGEDLIPGQYCLTARAQQPSSANTEETSIVVRVGSSSVFIETPVSETVYPVVTEASGMRHTTLAVAHGTAYAGNGLATIAEVRTRLSRTLSDGTVAYWAGGATWHAAYDDAQHEGLANGTSDWSLLLPTWEQGFVAATYTFRVSATTDDGTPVSQESHFTLSNVYDVTGRVTTMDSNGNAIALQDVTVSRSGAVLDGASATAITNGAGYYTFHMVPVGHYTFTPVLPGRVFTPTAATVEVVDKDLAAPTISTGYLIQGRITSGTEPVAGVTVRRDGADNDSPTSTLTDSNGDYRLVNVPNGSYTVSAIKSPYLFSPAARVVIIDGFNATLENFSVTSTHRLYGRVSTAKGLAMPNVRVTRSGSNTSVLTNSAGYYVFTGVPNDTYTITASLDGYSFAPTEKVVTIAGADVFNQNFVGAGGAAISASSTYRLYGRVSTSNGIAIPNVRVSRSDSNTSVMTNSAGYYTFYGLSNGTYLITPSLSGYSFTPTTKTVTIADTDAGNQNLIGAPD